MESTTREEEQGARQADHEADPAAPADPKPDGSPRFYLAGVVRKLNPKFERLEAERQAKLLGTWRASWTALVLEVDRAPDDAAARNLIERWEERWEERLEP